jgi:exodeoxyribonuclease V alpha subunit
VRYPYAGLHELNLSFALTVHKSQGGEYPIVVLPLLTSHAVMLNRTLLYTGVTRARRVVVIVGQPKGARLAARGTAHGAPGATGWNAGLRPTPQAGHARRRQRRRRGRRGARLAGRTGGERHRG